MHISFQSAKLRYLLVLGVAVVFFALGWFLRPSVRVAGFPEIGELQPFTKRGCTKVGVPLTELGAFSEASLRYSPGDSARLQVVVFRRAGPDAELLQLDAGEYDDEFDASGEVFKLRWDAAKGWQVDDCHVVVRYWPGRP
ncbi:hypothetical protein WMF39_01055 [Sorangium sp. So ce1504]|uniref:hypothetical protein n=1 Tax=Sorangium sp. So ce1504 TaxID=3133337 RepID=UPI003F634DD6